MSATVTDRAHGSGWVPLKYGAGYKYGDNRKYGGLSPYIVTYDNPVVIGQLVKVPTEYENVFFVGRVIQSTFGLKNGVVEKQIVISGEVEEIEESAEG